MINIDVRGAKRWLSSLLESDEVIRNLGNSRLVLFENANKRLILAKGAVKETSLLTQCGDRKIKVLKGSMSIKWVQTAQIDMSQRIGSYLVSGDTQTSFLFNNQCVQLTSDIATAITTNSNTIWLEEQTKAKAAKQRVKFCSASLRPTDIYHSKQSERILRGVVELFQQSDCELSLKALHTLSKSSISEVSWQAIEGIYLRSKRQKHYA
ncbi:hypothetical protein ACSLBF_12430 [Pseudoalteromonas sp. T1lg65]|uniref:hypothetical protein n=1 Tax=Pseudoalteromonas sp. T1lg65 TaxID=2077101 RepID=UPI003F796746